jgi:hypothetical protein
MLLQAAHSEGKSLTELRAKRKTLWRRFESNPNEIHLAAILRVLDDQIAQANEQSDRAVQNVCASEAAAVPEVGGLFLLLSLSQREKGKPNSAQATSNDSASASAN